MSEAPSGAAIVTQMKPVGVFIDGRHLQVDARMTILQAAESEGVYIPTLCHDPRLAPAARCGLCVVEVAGLGMVQACETPVSEGLEIVTLSPAIAEARKSGSTNFFLTTTPTASLPATTPARRVSTFPVTSRRSPRVTMPGPFGSSKNASLSPASSAGCARGLARAPAGVRRWMGSR